MAVPMQVRKQSEAVRKLYEEVNAEPDGTVTEQVSPAPAEGSVTESPAKRANVPATPAPSPVAVEPSEPEPPKGDTPAEQRYRTLQGMYNADTARLRSENQQLQQRMTQLESLLSSISTKPAVAEGPAEKLITEQDIADYGDSIDVMRRVTKEETAAQARRMAELEAMVQQMRTNIIPRVEQVAQRQANSAEQSFWSSLEGIVPNWKEINSDTGFHSWLLEVDPLTGYNRQKYLDEAQDAMDVRRVANFFLTWQGSSGQRVAQPTRQAATSQLEKQISPGRGRTSGASAAQTAKTYTPKEIKTFFDDVRRGVYRDNEVERSRIERDIFAAQRDGRIIAAG